MEQSAEGYTTKRRFFRKQLVIPAEHGSWSWLLVPYFVGLLVAGQWNLAALLVLVGGLAGFLVRQPLTAWMRVRTGRGRRADGPLAAAWTLGFGILAFLCLAGLMALGYAMLLWLLVPMSVVFILYLAAARQRRASMRTLWMEVAGAAGLAAMAPASYIVASGRLDSLAWTLWALMAGQNVLGVLYVRLRIADTHRRPISRPPIFWTHVFLLAIAAAAASFGTVPWLAVVPFVGFMLRAGWAVIQARPVANVKRFGFTEVGVEIGGGALVVIGYWLV